MTESPAVEVAKERREAEGQAGVVTLSTGVRARLVPVSASLIDEVRSRVRAPKVPVWHNPDNDRDEENPLDPEYRRAVGEYEQALGLAAMDALILFGVELIDPIPGGWQKKLRRLGIEVDESDPDEVEFAYKKYVAVSIQDVQAIGQRSGVTGAAVERAAASF